MTTMHNSEPSLEVRELKDDELDLVSGGAVAAGWDMVQNKKCDGGGATTDPIGAWNQLLHNYGF